MPETYLHGLVMNSVCCPVLNKMQTIKKKKWNLGFHSYSSRSMLYKTVFLLQHLILCPLHCYKWKKSTRNFLLLSPFSKLEKWSSIPSSAWGGALHVGVRLCCVTETPQFSPTSSDGGVWWQDMPLWEHTYFHRIFSFLSVRHVRYVLMTTPD